MPDKDMQLLPLTFEKGINEYLEESMLPVGASSSLVNWEPSPAGELRARVPFVKGSTTGAPATRRVRGFGYFSRMVQPAIVQKSVVGTDVLGNTSVATSWPTATTLGSTLVLVVAVIGSASTPTITTPSGWTSATASTGAASNTPKTQIFYKANAASESGSVTVSGTNWVDSMAQLIEIANLTSSPLDVVSSAQATNATITTGATGATAQPVEIAIGIMADARLEAQGSITNSFETVNTTSLDGAVDLTVGVYSKVTSATGAQQVSATTSTSDKYAGSLAVFKSWFTTTPASGQTASTNLVAAVDNNSTGYDIYVIDRDNVSAGTWTNVGTITSSDRAKLVAMAPGFGSVFITTPDIGTVYRYDGSTLASVAAAPPGRCIAVHHNRLFVGGTNAFPGRLYFSNINNYGTFDATYGYQDILRESGEPIEDITPFEDYLVIGTRTKLFTFSGFGPDTFYLKSMPLGGIAPGRTLIATPYGCICIGRKYVWLLADDTVNLASRYVSKNYGMTGSYMVGSYLYDVAYILDQGSGNMWAINLPMGVWWQETVGSSANDKPASIFNHDDMQVMGPSASTIGSLANYRLIPGTSRGKDFDTLSETFHAQTVEIYPTGPEYQHTARWLFLKVRQYGAGEGQTGLTVTPYYDGEEGTPETFGPEPTAGVYRYRMDLGEMKRANSIQFDFDQVVTSTQTSVVTPEEAALGFYVEKIS